MKQIILIRHTKASQNLIFDDFDRPIIEEGIENSIKIASKTLAFYKNLSNIYILLLVQQKEHCKRLKFFQKFGILILN